MKTKTHSAMKRLLLSTGMLVALASPALATFHEMQIEQVIGGVDGDPTAQAIQLRIVTPEG